MNTAPLDRSTATMQAIVRDRYGDTDHVLRPDTIERPAIADHEVLVQVEAAGVDRGAWHLVTGLPYPIRLAGYGLRAPKNPVPGREVSGHVVDVGAAVTSVRVGDDVFGIAEGSFAQYARARADRLAPKPQRLDFTSAAAATISAITALQAVRDHGRVHPGHRVLVIGASGGVGTFAVQIAKAHGADVTGVCSTSKIDLVRSIGADHVIDYTTDDITTEGVRYDVILDIAGNRPLRLLRRALAPRGTLVIVGGENGGRWLGGSDRQLRALALSPFVGQKLRTFIASENHDDLLVIAALIDSGKVTPVVERTFPLDETATAIRYLHDGHARGKVVITPPVASATSATLGT